LLSAVTKRESDGRKDSARFRFPTDQCIHELVSQKARSLPDGLAVSGFGRELRYHDLELRSNRLANLLRQKGAGPEICIGLCANRSPELIVAALAILKCGGAYVPLDPSYPAARIAHILRDAGVRIVVVQPETARLLPAGDWETVVVDPRAGDLAAYSSAAPSGGVTAGNLAYVIYTSGSTGQPKGVEITHASLLNLIFWHQQTFHVTAEDRATLLTSPGFDAAVWETWPYLAAGASLHLPEESTRLSAEMLLDWLVDNAITISFAPTVIAERLLRLPWPEQTALRVLLTGADRLNGRPPANLPFKFVNNYGPTECTVVATSGEVEAEHASGNGNNEPPSIGRPIANTEAWILDADLQPVPAGTPGELCISGAGLARGYRNRDDLTAERFVQNPSDDGRIYLTGDRARLLADGQIAFMGRLDGQIKIRGFRIEPAEIVMALNRYPGVVESAVIAREDTPGEQRLVAYIVQAADARVAESEIADYLRETLPEYMVPSAFVSLAALPLTSHGKLDREGLPVPGSAGTQGEREYIAARTPVEQELAMILASLMGLERVSIHENFFLLGGHSLLGTQVIARVRDAFGIELPLRSLFDAPTVADLSSEIERLILRKLEAAHANGSEERSV
jgi:amino acid adenylation domain-containing protein